MRMAFGSVVSGQDGSKVEILGWYDFDMSVTFIPNPRLTEPRPSAPTPDTAAASPQPAVSPSPTDPRP